MANESREEWRSRSGVDIDILDLADSPATNPMVQIRGTHSSSRWVVSVIWFIRSEFRRFAVPSLMLVALMVSTGCRTPVSTSLLVLTVTNDLGRTISEIRKKPCGDLGLALVPIEDSRFGPGETRGVVLPPTCVDLVAFDSHGRIVGEQRGLTMLAGARWVLRR
jgi:hypothetical protein